MANISLDAYALEQLNGDQKALLDTIDDLRKHGAGQLIDLPQIIVVGDQSSGKSSVLEAISRVRFPIKDGLCTRFATELVLRTDSRLKVDVKIQPVSSTSKDVQSFSETRFDKDELPKIIEDAKQAILQGGVGFSEDVLRVEICGPDVPHLTLVDLPGFYHSEDDSQSAADREVVERLVECYMAKKNSIILAIVSARNQLTLQKVLSKVKIHDQDRTRTLGIITKPDTLEAESQDEENFVQLAKNLDKSHWLSLGWHVLRNRGEGEEATSDRERDEKERVFFQTSSWSSVPSRNRGVDVLRRKLSKILFSHIKSHMQTLIEGIISKISERQTRLKRLGEPRQGSRELRAYLDRIASQFHILSLHAVDGNYSHEFFGGLYPDSRGMTYMDGRIRKLRALIRDLNRIFAYILATKGSTNVILPKGVSVEDDKGQQEESLHQGLPYYLQNLVSFYQFKDPDRISFERAAGQLEIHYSANQGTEFPGTSNDRIAVEFFRYQSQPWETIAHAHVQIILQIAQNFVEKLLSHLTGPDKRTNSAILSEVVDPFFEAKTSLLEKKIKELLHHYRRGQPQPLDMEFQTTLTNRYRSSLEKEFLQHLLTSQPDLFTDAARGKLKCDKDPTYQTEFDPEGLINKAEAYYKTSLRTFTENMIILGIENCLIEDLPNIFTSDKVNQMNDDQLEYLAAESDEIQVERAALKEEYESLKKGLQFCNKYRERKPTLFAELDSLPIRPAPTPAMSLTTPAISPPQTVKKPQADVSQSDTQEQTQVPPKPRSIFDDISNNTSYKKTTFGAFTGFSTPKSPAAGDRLVEIQSQAPSISTRPLVEPDSGVFGKPVSKTPSSSLFGTTAPKPSSGGLFGNTASNATSSGLSSNLESKTPSGGLFGNTNSKGTSGGLSSNLESKTPSSGLFGNTNSKGTSGGLSSNLESKTSGGLFGNTASNATSSGLYANLESKTTRGGLFGNTNSKGTSSSFLSNTSPSIKNNGSFGLFGSSTANGAVGSSITKTDPIMGRDGSSSSTSE